MNENSWRPWRSWREKNDLLDKAFGEAEVDYLLQILDSNQYIREGRRLRFYKIHGDVADWNNVILAGDSYRTFPDRYRFLSNQFDVLLTQNPVLFIGCSMLDDRVAGLDRSTDVRRGGIDQ